MAYVSLLPLISQENTFLPRGVCLYYPDYGKPLMTKWLLQAREGLPIGALHHPR